MDLRQLRGGDDLVLAGVGPAIGNVVFDRIIEQNRVLRHDADGAANTRLLHRAQILAIDGDSSSADVVKTIKEPRQGRLSRAAGTDHRDRAPRRYGERHVEQNLAVGLVTKIDMLEAHLAGARQKRCGARRILDFGILIDKVEHALHVGHRLLDLAINDTQKIERDIELDHEGVDQHQIADGHRASDHTQRRPPHDQRYSNGDDRALPDIEQ